jgi:hypothetical protein
MFNYNNLKKKPDHFKSQDLVIPSRNKTGHYFATLPRLLVWSDQVTDWTTANRQHGAIHQQDEQLLKNNLPQFMEALKCCGTHPPHTTRLHNPNNAMYSSLKLALLIYYISSFKVYHSFT